MVKCRRESFSLSFCTCPSFQSRSYLCSHSSGITPMVPSFSNRCGCLCTNAFCRSTNATGISP
ncbi:SWIM zinc finger family protein [[Flexibacter] sp. ATCC 35208]|uniref:SWIM zinc finger family protein n=1 Tax=unclassified Chitinophaga TaxID=2619133 RepID=UPI0034D37153